ncbi:DUF4126 domain-containing protein [Sphingomonas sp. ZT3P38]|uniref:DUF4126 domain-containing protein n=1 Tax=Parasphingomonas zepuensis TaxID=3096161 RepID=UPI002FC76968
MLILSLLIGIVAGLRAMMAPAAISWAAACGLLALEGSWLAFLGWRFTPWIFSLLAIAELVTDKLPSTASRKVPPQFAARLISGGLSGAAIGIAGGSWPIGLALGVAGALIGTLGGAVARARLATAFGRDLPAALTEDAVAIALSVAVVLSL